MIRRILWDIALVIVVFAAPWWAALCVGIAGVVLFPWYIEIVIAGAIYDALFGGVARHWYAHFTHTAIFALPLIIAEFIKTKINI